MAASYEALGGCVPESRQLEQHLELQQRRQPQQQQRNQQRSVRPDCDNVRFSNLKRRKQYISQGVCSQP